MHQVWSDSKQPFAGHGSTLTKTSAKGWRAAVANGRVMRGGTHYALFDLQKVRHAYRFNSQSSAAFFRARCLFARANILVRVDFTATVACIFRSFSSKNVQARKTFLHECTAEPGPIRYG